MKIMKGEASQLSVLSPLMPKIAGIIITIPQRKEKKGRGKCVPKKNWIVRAKREAWTPNQPIKERAIEKEIMMAPILPKD